jgi:excisionase family DNA binding protein
MRRRLEAPFGAQGTVSGYRLTFVSRPGRWPNSSHRRTPKPAPQTGCVVLGGRPHVPPRHAHELQPAAGTARPATRKAMTARCRARLAIGVDAMGLPRYWEQRRPWLRSLNAGARSVAQRCLEFVVEEDPSASELVAGEQTMASRATQERPHLTREDVAAAREVAELLGLPLSTVFEYARRGVIPGHKLGRRWIFLHDEIEASLRMAPALYASRATEVTAPHPPPPSSAKQPMRQGRAEARARAGEQPSLFG